MVMNGAKYKLNQALGKSAETGVYIKELVNSHIELKKVELSSIIGRLFFAFVFISIISILILGVAIFSLLGLTYFLAEQVGQYKAFLIVSFLLILFILVFILISSMIKDSINRKVTQQFFDGKKEAPDKQSTLLKINKLEQLIDQSTKEIPKSVKQLSFKDFMPGGGSLASSTFWDKLTKSPLTGAFVSFAFSIAEKKFTKKRK